MKFFKYPIRLSISFKISRYLCLGLYAQVKRWCMCVVLATHASTECLYILYTACSVSP